MKPSYYTAQESAYKRIRERGEAGWQKKTFEEFRDPITDKIITDYVKAVFKSTHGLAALDLGTGSGPTAHTLYDLGFNVTGIDVCPSAILMAQEIALKMDKKINFEVADVLNLKDKYDLIYDSHCAHCVVTETDREIFFNSIYASLKPEGFFILDTMAFNNSNDAWIEFDTLRFDENFILWHKTKGETHTDVVKVGDTFWCPQRRIYPVDKLLAEVKAAGFHIITSDTLEYGPREPLLLRALCQKA